MDAWGFEQVGPWLAARVELPVGPLFCVIDGPTPRAAVVERHARVEFRRLAAHPNVRRDSWSQVEQTPRGWGAPSLAPGWAIDAELNLLEEKIGPPDLMFQPFRVRSWRPRRSG
jgi:hypothetical protein